MRIFRHFFIAAAAGAVAGPVLAQEGDWSGRIAVGPGLRPDYVGSDDLEATPYVSARIRWRAFYVDIQGDQVALNLSPLSHLAFGPMVQGENGRDASVKSAAVKRMAPIDDAFHAGAFAAWSVNGVLTERDEMTAQVSYMADVSDTSEGAIAAFGLSYGVQVDERWTVGAAVRANHVDDKYAATYFGVSAADAKASGLDPFSAGSGLRDVGFSAKVSYALTRRWEVQMLGSYKRLVGDFADSPLVKTEGSADQFSAALAVGYRF